MNLRPFRFGVVAGQAPSGEAWIAEARRAEQLGYATFLIPDTLGPTFAPLPALAIAAAATRTLRVGTYVLANDLRNPVLVARESITLDFLSGGRFELGLGAGRSGIEEDYRKLGIPFGSGGLRVERLAEALGIIKALLSGRQASAPGPHYAVSGADSFPAAFQAPHLPVMVAAGGRRLLALAAREANIVALAIQPDEGQAMVAEKVGWLREAAGARFDELELCVSLMAAGEQVHPWIASRYSLADLSQSPAALLGTIDQMCDRLERRREALGISYLNIAADMMDVLAPVVERLAGR